MYFSDEALEQLQASYREIGGKGQKLQEDYLARNYNNERAREYARHGFSRRLKTMMRCIKNTFDILPPDRTDFPTHEELTDAAINIQAFVFNVFGSTDNLAWIWVREKGLKKNDGSSIPQSHVGLRKNNELIRGSFSPGFQEYLEGLDDWFNNLENFRHSLAHRIPLYIPPYMVPKSNLEAYQELEAQKTDALRLLDFSEHDRLTAEQLDLANFRPWMTHSFEEDAETVVFHAQMLADFNTIEELGRKMLEELDL